MSTRAATTEHVDPSGAIVFTDIVGFTELTAVQGDDAALAVLTRQDHLVRDALPASARVVKELGDGLLLWFTGAGDAVATSLRLQTRYDEVAGDDFPLGVRIGIHWGSPKRRGNDIIGHDVNLASRIAALAGAGEVLCSEVAAQRAAADGISADVVFEPLGPVYVRGIVDPVPLVRVSSTDDARSDGRLSIRASE